jgi:hypothetical protein
VEEERKMRLGKRKTMTRVNPGIMGVVITILVNLAGPAAQSASTIYFADPGKSFGPIQIGEPPPRGWWAKCHFNGLEEYLFPSEGLVAKVDTGYLHRLTVFAVSTSPYAKIIEPPVTPPHYWTVGDFFSGCVTMDRKNLPSSTRLALPLQFPTVVTNKGVQLGATVEETFSKHGAPDHVSTYPSSIEIASIEYCGLKHPSPLAE